MCCRGACDEGALLFGAGIRCRMFNDRENDQSARFRPDAPDEQRNLKELKEIIIRSYNFAMCIDNYEILDLIYKSAVPRSNEQIHDQVWWVPSSHNFKASKVTVLSAGKPYTTYNLQLTLQKSQCDIHVRFHFIAYLYAQKLFFLCSKVVSLFFSK
ncbi:hypothetical protein OSTOST_09715 [Ostertagia ostertagi]